MGGGREGRKERRRKRELTKCRNDSYTYTTHSPRRPTTTMCEDRRREEKKKGEEDEKGGVGEEDRIKCHIVLLLPFSQRRQHT